MNNSQNNTALFHLHTDLSASPELIYKRTDGQEAEINFASGTSNKEGFKIDLAIALPYDALSKVANSCLKNMRYELSEGFISKHVIFKNCRLYNSLNGKLGIEVKFGGSYTGTAFFHGVPYYNAPAKRIEIQQMDYDLQTNSFLLKAAQWLFDKRILSEIKKFTAFDVKGYYTAAAESINLWLNKEWRNGIKGTGTVTEITLSNIELQQDHLLTRCSCTGQLQIEINENELIIQSANSPTRDL